MELPYIINIQKYSIHDGDGIRTTVFFKGEALHWNHFAAFVCLVLAVYFVFYK